MARRVTVFLLLLLLDAAGALPAAAGPDEDPPQAVPAGITCCDETKIRAAMAEEALRRIAAIAAGSPAGETDFLSARAWEKVRRRLDGLGNEAAAGELRRALEEADADKDTREFRELVGHFVLGMTLEIGLTFQDEYDRALICLEQAGRLAAALENEPAADSQALSRAMFRAGVTDHELRRLRSLERKWREAPANADPFELFNLMKKNATGRAADPDQAMAFTLAARYRSTFPFLDEFLENYRRLAGELRAKAREVNEILALTED